LLRAGSTLRLPWCEILGLFTCRAVGSSRQMDCTRKTEVQVGERVRVRGTDRFSRVPAFFRQGIRPPGILRAGRGDLDDGSPHAAGLVGVWSTPVISHKCLGRTPCPKHGGQAGRESATDMVP
jgi:hypothetical protein